MEDAEGRTNIEALVARGKSTFEGIPRDGLAWELADALERQQAVVEAARAINSQQDGSDMRGATKDPPSEDVLVALDIALAALDAPPGEGEG